MTQPFAEPIYVTRPILPSPHDLRARPEAEWAAQWLHTAGPEHARHAEAIRHYLAFPYASLFTPRPNTQLAPLRDS